MPASLHLHTHCFLVPAPQHERFARYFADDKDIRVQPAGPPAAPPANREERDRRDSNTRSDGSSLSSTGTGRATFSQ